MDLRFKALDLAKGLEPTVSNIERVRLETDAESASWAFTQWRLRNKARVKFEKAAEMLFSAEALEQATHEKIAEYHASRFPSGALVADLTCGIGADLIGLARRGPVVGFEIDSERARYADHNLGVHGVEAEVRVEDSLAFLQGSKAIPFKYAFVDPSRRFDGRRTLNIDLFEPNVSALVAILEKLELAGIKLSPMLPDAELEKVGPCLEFVSFGGECREALVWIGKQAQVGRWAVRVESGSRLEAGEPHESFNQPLDYLYEADPAAIRAHCLGTLCRMHDLKPLADSNGYLTSDHLVQDEWMKSYRVEAHGSSDEKTLRRLLRELNGRVTVVKSRAQGVEPEELLRKLRTKGARPLTLVVYAVGMSRRYAMVTPVEG